MIIQQPQTLSENPALSLVQALSSPSQVVTTLQQSMTVTNIHTSTNPALAAQLNPAHSQSTLPQDETLCDNNAPGFIITSPQRTEDNAIEAGAATATVMSTTDPPCTSRPPLSVTQAPHTTTTVMSTPVAVSTGHTVSRSTVTFPSTSHRQRSSNITVNNPEVEFLNTALTSCRSTISQQETEIKRLKECLDIRNKRITQLELQVGHASETFSARTTHTDSGASMAAINDKLDNIADKLKNVQTVHPPNSIVINSCHGHNAQAMKQHIATQTQSLTVFSGDVLGADIADTKDAEHDSLPQQELSSPTPTL